jgi:uncharacterized protein YkwD
MFSALGRRRARFLAAALCVAALAAGCVSGSGAPPTPQPAPPSTSANVVELVAVVNQVRADHGLPPFARNGQLDALAGDWAAHMASTGVFAHRDLQATIEQPAFSGFRRLGENILRGVCAISAREMVDAWMNSAGHRDNVLSTVYDTIGIGVVCGPDGRVWATQNFGDAR